MLSRGCQFAAFRQRKLPIARCDGLYRSSVRWKRSSAKSARAGAGAAGSDRHMALTMAIRQIESSFGKGAVMQLGSTKIAERVEVISSGSLSLDVALGIGGIPRGRVVEIYGPESSGK
uniref:RecA family profile 1 domain-containing protein n=1 Tax=Hyaloperonospora arabidopsidis (strain Emoy2) TaxID=559515 RepID=M4C6U1_HYAAE